MMSFTQKRSFQQPIRQECGKRFGGIRCYFVGYHEELHSHK